ncbi:aminoglycoside phosphotransferase [Streptomyces radicis]|uniref:Aminoglycoside phosphotransferase n=1 Tax=Streptomyces radicis TaxID=1750517 RepID=A0A3A9WDS6_9ACTN|nr:aminoglycoside phosphotransferase [Streptomyces radicis]RKN10920.1 aminoglycoside phosphotransferase [Streptomyces radicis]RKN25183.1 aminoglycoside phosphotransferase [Streptomyces radicis]
MNGRGTAVAARRVTWDELPGPVRREVEAVLGPVAAARPLPAGSSPLTAVLETPAGTVCVEGAPLDDGARAAAFEARAHAAARTTGIAPRMRGRWAVGGWHVLAHDHAPGRTADLSPGSPDLPLVAALLDQASLRTGPDALPLLADRLGAGPGGARWLAGEWLLHTALAPGALLVDGRRAWLPDWSNAARGPAWCDVADAVLCLIDAGHTPAAALDWAAHLPVWSHIRPDTLTAWTHARRTAGHHEPPPGALDELLSHL